MSMFRAAWLLLLLPIIVQCEAQHKRHRPTSEESELERIRILIDEDRLDQADSALKKFLSAHDSPRGYFEKARLDIRHGDSTAYCQDLVQAKRLNLPELDMLYDQHCVQVDSGGLGQYGFDPAMHPGLVKVKRFRYKSDGSSQVFLLDQLDSTHVGVRSESTGTSYILLDTMPVFPGGDTARFAFLRRNSRYPDEEFEQEVQGTVIVRFTIEADGRITEVHPLRRVTAGLDKEALRLIGLMPPWIPGKLHGMPVRCTTMLPIVFALR